MATTFISIDPGSIRAGFCIMQGTGNQPKVISSGVIHLSEELPLAERLFQLANDLESVLHKYRPSVLAMESVFFSKNPHSTIQLGQARGVILMKAAEAGLEIFEYSPAEVKLSVTGSGKASKDQVEKMIRLLLRLPSKFQFETSDEADAIAIGFAHASVSCSKTKGISGIKSPKRNKRRDRVSFWQTSVQDSDAIRD